MSFRTVVPVSEVRGHVVRAWHSTTPHLMGWNAHPVDVWVYLLDDGRLVGQDWYQGAEYPTRHYLKASTPERAERKISELRPSSWAEYDSPSQIVIIAGRYTP
jgi:hypothetical protein